MKHFILIILLLAVSLKLFSQESDEINDNRFEIDLYGSLRFTFPVPKLLFFAFADFGIGIEYNIIPKHYSIGIACDAAIGLDWLNIFSKDKEVKNDEIGTKYTQFGFSLGSRIYNLVKISYFKIIPFFGCDFLFIMLPMPYVGIEIGYRKYGIEYALYLPELNITPIRHQLSLKVHI